MPKITSLIKSLDQQKLSADQKKYFKLLSDIEAMDKDKKERHEFYSALLNKYHQHVVPIMKTTALGYKEMAIKIDALSNKVKVSKNTMQQCEDLIPMMIEKYYSYFTEDEATRALYEQWAKSHTVTDSFEEVDDFNKILMRKKIKDTFGIDVDPEDADIDLNDPTSYANFFEKYGEEIKNKQESEKEKWDNRQKTKKDLSREARQKADKRNIREIYIGLAKKLHPDKAGTDEDKSRNEAAMKRITEAYENNDIITLLNLEIKYLNYNENDFLKLDNNKIKSFISLLTEQKNKLATEVEMVKTHPSFQDIYKYILHSSPAKSLKLFDQDVAAYKNNKAFLTGSIDTLKQINSKADYQKFISYLHDQFQDEFDDFDMFDNIDFKDGGLMDDDFFEEEEYGPAKKKKKGKK